MTGRRGIGCAGRPAELDLEPPAAIVGPRLAPELDRADLGHPRRQADRHALGLRLAADSHQALERRQFADRVGVGRDQVARPVVGPDRAARQREGDRLAHQEVEVVAGDRDLLPFLGIARDDAEPGLVGRLGLEADVERPSRAAADPDAAAAPDHAVVRRAVRHGQVERGIRQDARSVRSPGSSANHEETTSTIRSRTMSGVSAPPLKRIASGRAGRSSGWCPAGSIASARCRRRK